MSRRSGELSLELLDVWVESLGSLGQVAGDIAPLLSINAALDVEEEVVGTGTEVAEEVDSGGEVVIAIEVALGEILHTRAGEREQDEVVETGEGHEDGLNGVLVPGDPTVVGALEFGVRGGVGSHVDNVINYKCGVL